MGLSTSSLLLCRRVPELRILMVGLDASGKTTMLYRLKTGQVCTVIPTIGFNVETLQIDDRVALTMWDLGIRDKMWPLVRHYFANSHGMIFMIDSNDRERLSEALDRLYQISEELDGEGLPDLPIAVLCNKCDMQKEAVATTFTEVTELLTDEANLKRHPSLYRRPRKCFAVSAATGEGLTDSLSWLVSAALKEETETVSLEETKTVAKPQSAWSSLYHAVKSAMIR